MPVLRDDVGHQFPTHELIEVVAIQKKTLKISPKSISELKGFKLGTS
jgi:hypothetical protein